MTTAINVFTVLIVTWFIWRQYTKHGSFLQLGIVFVANLAIGYPLRLIVVGHSDDVITEWPLDAYRSQLFELSVISLIGIALFILGYLVVDGRRGQLTFLRSVSIEREQQPTTLIWFLFSVSVLGKVLKFATGNYVAFLLAESGDLAYRNVLENLHRVGWVAFAAICVLAFQRKIYRRSDWFLLWAIVGVEFLYQVIQGSKTFLMLPLFIIALCYYYAKNRIPIIVGVAAVFFMAFFVFPFVSAYRDVLQANYRQGIPTFSELDSVAVLSETFRVAFLDEVGPIAAAGPEAPAMGTVFHRLGAADELFRFIEVVPEQLPYRFGRDFLGVVVSVIPRVVWPDKPTFSPGADYGLWLDTVTSVTPFPLGEMYWNWGHVGVVLGMFLWGAMLAMVMRFASRLFHARGAQLYVVGIFLAELYWYTSTESMLPIVIASLVQKVIIYYVLFMAYTVIFLRRQGQPRLVGDIR